MKVVFQEKDPQKVLAAIKGAMGGRKLAEIVDFALKKGQLEVIISKMGTSTLAFTEACTDKGLEYTLSSEKIAFTHRPFKDEVTGKIVQVIEAAGGKVTA